MFITFHKSNTETTMDILKLQIASKEAQEKMDLEIAQMDKDIAQIELSQVDYEFIQGEKFAQMEKEIDQMEEKIVQEEKEIVQDWMDLIRMAKEIGQTTMVTDFVKTLITNNYS